MTNNTMKTRLLTSTIIIGLLGGVPALSANAQQPAEVNPPKDEVVVTGIRSSVLSQKEAKRNSKNVSDSIFAEDMGKMPDENIAEAMQRITGVGIDRVDGEGSTVTVRGVDASLNNITMNGVVVTNGGDDNAVDFSTMSADMLRSIEVVKSPSANHDEGSLGGSVNLKTFRPIDSKRRRLGGTVQLKKNSLADKTDLALKANFVDKFADGKFGIAASGFYDEQSVRQDFYNIFNWRTFSNIGAASTSVQDGTRARVAYDPASREVGYKTNERVRFGGATTLEFRPDDVSSFVVDLSYSNLGVEALSHQTRVNGLAGRFSINEVDNVSGTSFFASNPTRGAGNVLTRDQETETETIIGSAEYNREFGEWNLAAKAAISDADQVWIRNRRVNFRQAPGRENVSADWLDANGNIQTVPTLSYDPTLPNFEPSRMNLFQIFDDDRAVQDTYKSISLDLAGPVNFGPVNEIEVGGKYFVRTKDRTQTTGNTPFSRDSNGNFVTLADVGSPFPVDDYFEGVLDNPVAGWIVPDSDFVHDTYLPGGFAGDPDLINTYTVKTKATAGYIKANYDAFDDRLSGDFGVRIVKTESSSIGNQGINFPAALGGDRVITPVNLQNSYTDVLPSFNSRFIITEDMLLRLSAAKVMARPTQTQLRPGTVLNATNPTNVRGTGGNPELDPTRATQFDVSWEWYFSESGLLSIAGFYKDIDSFIFDRTDDTTVFNCPTGVAQANCDVVTDFITNNGGVPIRQSINGAGGKIKGVELSFQTDFTFLPGFLKDFGTVMNYTYTDSEATFVDATEANAAFYEDFPFLNTSKDTFNSTVYWEKNGHSLRLAYNYRSPRLVSAVTLNSSVWQDSRQSLDLSGVVNVNKNFNFTFAATNLTNESNRQFTTRTIGETFFTGTANEITLAGEGNALKTDAPRWRTNRFDNTGINFRIGANVKF